MVTVVQMPLYEFKCRACGHRFDELVKLDETPRRARSAAIAAPERLFSDVGRRQHGSQPQAHGRRRPAAPPARSSARRTTRKPYTSAITARSTPKAADALVAPAGRPRTLARGLRTSVMKSSRLLPLIVACALFVENMDSTVLSTSLPAIAADLATDPIALKLALTTYLLVARRVHSGQRLGRRTGSARGPTFMSAIAVFLLGSIGVRAQRLARHARRGRVSCRAWAAR